MITEMFLLNLKHQNAQICADAAEKAPERCLVLWEKCLLAIALFLSNQMYTALHSGSLWRNLNISLSLSLSLSRMNYLHLL